MGYTDYKKVLDLSEILFNSEWHLKNIITDITDKNIGVIKNPQWSPNLGNNNSKTRL
jgi:hypothetical protein